MLVNETRSLYKLALNAGHTVEQILDDHVLLQAQRELVDLRVRLELLGIRVEVPAEEGPLRIPARNLGAIQEGLLLGSERTLFRDDHFGYGVQNARRNLNDIGTGVLQDLSHN